MIRFYTLLVLVIICTGCNSDDNGGTPPNVENLPPMAFDLLSVADTSTNVDVLSEFTWEAATDPENGSVTYTLFLSTDSDSETVISTDISSTSFTLTERLELNTTYYWKVRATDDNGNSTDSEVFRFTTRDLTAELLTVDANFPPRYLFAASVFQNKVWVIGGLVPDDGDTNRANDIWSSQDGINWTLEVEEAPFSPRFGLKSIVFQEKLWVIGGFDREDTRNDVWSSVDGINWTLEVEEANFPGLRSHELVVFNDRLWIIAGVNGFMLQRKIWSSSNGINWVEEVAETPFTSRTTASTVFDNRMWVISGSQVTSSDLSDVWSSTNGVDWTLEIENAEFLPKSLHTVESFSNKLWVLAGRSESPDPEEADFLSNTVWTSTNGTEWTMADDATQFSKRRGHQSVLFNGGILLLGGAGETGLLNDVWFLD
ncbi:MAG: kelch repeat-containing protein [Bacteroidota bacterium]